MMANRISVLLLVVLSAGMAAGILVNAGTGWDFANFYDAGHKVLAGQMQDLYNSEVLIGGKAPEGKLAYYGTPISALLFTTLAWMSPARALVVFKIENAIVTLLGLALLYRYNRRFAEKAGYRREHYRALFLAAAVLFQPFWTVYRVGGQTTPTLFLGFVLALSWFLSGRMGAAAICLVALVAIKPAFLLNLGLLAVMAGARFLTYTMITGAILGGVSILTLGWTIHQRFLQHLASIRISVWLYNSSLSVLFDNLMDLRGENRWLGIGSAGVRVLAAGLVLVVLLQGRKRISSPEGRRHFLFLMAMPFGLLLMPVVWDHYLAVLFIPLAYWMAMGPQLGRPERLMLVLFGLSCCTQNLILTLWLSTHWQITSVGAAIGTGLYKSISLLLFTILVWRHGEQFAATYQTKAWQSQ